MTSLLSIPWPIPWEELASGDRAAIIWAGAALFAAFPAALAAILWVAAWRGSPLFGAPRCRACRAALRGSERSLPERCQECGREVIERGVPAIDYATRSWRPSVMAIGLVGGALSVAASLLLGWLGGAMVVRIEREAKATGHAGAVGPALVDGRSPRSVLDALRFAADSAMADPIVAKEAGEALRRYLVIGGSKGEAEAIAQDRGLGLLLDRHDSRDGRRLLIDLIGSLAALGFLDQAGVGEAMDRIAGAPTLLLGEPGNDGHGPTLRLIAGSPDLVARVARVSRAGVTLPTSQVRTEEGVAVTLDAPLGDETQLEVAWAIEWTPALTGSDDVAKPSNIEALPRFRWEGQSRLGHASTPPLFLARAIEPMFEAVSLGEATLLSGRIVATLHPAWSVDGTWWCEVGEERLPLRTRVTSEGMDISLDAVTASPVSSLPSTFTILFRPKAAWGDEGKAARREGIRWRQGRGS